MEVGKGLDLLPKKMIYVIGWHDLSRVFWEVVQRPRSSGIDGNNIQPNILSFLF